MRDLFSRLSRLCLPALALAVGLVAWSAGAQAGEGMHHQGGVHAMQTHGESMPCHEQTAKDAPGDRHDAGGHACPDCLCLSSGCASAALPGMTGLPTRSFAPVPLRARPVARLETQAQAGPPAEPPRL
ncbi:conserved exported protein of unknown function [Magnetospirillum sp. XM-1]|uniref:hypothetical protein n=1 Tax=Magnetospirillum sp. XM-1 TaxID=1663591 RepID=UPI00073DC450|nr:hypothetical protein [Magnetospirillum sp. XM-1]CUW38951.1 conserved exported protein of unknown function [Magnetospirillum sp. XM-1]